jgi:hypothetical protein
MDPLTLHLTFSSEDTDAARLIAARVTIYKDEHFPDGAHADPLGSRHSAVQATATTTSSGRSKLTPESRTVFNKPTYSEKSSAKP